MEELSLQYLITSLFAVPLVYVFYTVYSHLKGKALLELQKLEAQYVKTEAQRNVLRQLAREAVQLAEVYGAREHIADKATWAIGWLQERLDASGIDLDAKEISEAIQAAWAQAVLAGEELKE